MAPGIDAPKAHWGDDLTGQRREAYVALIAARDPKIRARLEQGFAGVMTAFYSRRGPA